MTTLQKAHKYFSLYIRKSNADQFGLVQCVTCPLLAPWKQIDNGHFIDRRYLATAFEEKNNHPQCHHCNRILDGNIPRYEKFINRTYGKGTADALRLQSQTGQCPDLKQIVVKYKELSQLFSNK